MKWTILSLLKWTTDYFTKHHIPNPRLDAEWLLAFSLNLKRVDLYVKFDQPLSELELADFKKIIVRRAEREPLQYIMGTQEFYGHTFEVNRHVLIPRQETELLVGWAIELLKEKFPETSPSILDIGCGSGCIGISIACEIKNALVSALDLSPEALALAKKNAEKCGVSDRMTFVEANLLPENRPSNMALDMIVTNPPYIPSGDIATLQQEVAAYEPRMALDGGIDGLDFYRQLITKSPSYLRSGGVMIAEIGLGQEESIRLIVEQSADWKWIGERKDFNQIVRFVGAERTAPSNIP